MNNKILTFFKLLLNPKTIRILLSLENNGYLKERNWVKSVKLKQSIGKNGEPIPWFTYPFIDFLKVRLIKNMKVFEFGSGNSTIWFAKRVSSIVSVEHNEKWYNKIREAIPQNAKIIFNNPTNENEYHKIIKTMTDKFDLIIVDAIDRVNCLRVSKDHLSENGVIILDNSNRPEYSDGINYLLKHNFKKIEFVGMTSSITTSSATTIFYKTDNCFLI